MTIQEILDAVIALEIEISNALPGEPELATLVSRAQSLRQEVDRVRDAQGALIPDAETPSTAQEKSVEELDQALRGLISAARSKREAAPT